MMYSITFSDLALKQLKKFNKETKIRVISVLKRSRFRPYAHVQKLANSSYFRLRVGNYRVIVDIINKELRIFVIEVSHRKNIYKK